MSIYLVYSVEQVSASLCPDLFSREIKISDNIFTVDIIDPKTLISRRQKETLMKSNLLSLVKNIRDPRTQILIPIAAARNILNELWSKIEQMVTIKRGTNIQSFLRILQLRGSYKRLILAFDLFIPKPHFILFPAEFMSGRSGSLEEMSMDQPMSNLTVFLIMINTI